MSNSIEGIETPIKQRFQGNGNGELTCGKRVFWLEQFPITPEYKTLHPNHITRFANDWSHGLLVKVEGDKGIVDREDGQGKCLIPLSELTVCGSDQTECPKSTVDPAYSEGIKPTGIEFV